jgi:hypothetical protein
LKIAVLCKNAIRRASRKLASGKKTQLPAIRRQNPAASPELRRSCDDSNYDAASASFVDPSGLWVASRDAWVAEEYAKELSGEQTRFGKGPNIRGVKTLRLFSGWTAIIVMNPNDAYSGYQHADAFARGVIEGLDASAYNYELSYKPGTLSRVDTNFNAAEVDEIRKALKQVFVQGWSYSSYGVLRHYGMAESESPNAKAYTHVYSFDGTWHRDAEDDVENLSSRARLPSFHGMWRGGGWASAWSVERAFLYLEGRDNPRGLGPNPETPTYWCFDGANALCRKIAANYYGDYFQFVSPKDYVLGSKEE